MSAIVSGLISGIFSMLIFDIFFGHILNRRFNFFPIYPAVYLIYVLVSYLISAFGNSIVMLISNIMFFVVMIHLLFDGSIKKKIFNFLIFLIVFIGVELISELIIIFILGSNYSWDNSGELFKFSVVSIERLTSFIFLYVLSRMVNKGGAYFRKRQLAWYLVLPFSTGFVYLSIFYSSVIKSLPEDIEILVIISCLLLLISNFIVFILFDYTFKLDSEKKELELYSIKLDLEKSYYTKLEEKNNSQKKFNHDLRNYLTTIANLASNNKNEEIFSVINNMSIEINSFEEVLYSNNAVLNAVISDKKIYAEKNDIEFNIEVNPSINIDFLQDIDMISIVGNTIDNALEASLKTEKPTVNLNIFNDENNNFLVINCENNFDGKIVTKNGKIITSKNDKDGHGLGINNIRNSVDKYGGFVDIDVKDCIFSISIIISICKK